MDMNAATVTCDDVEAASLEHANSSAMEDQPRTRDSQLARAEVALQATIFVIAVTGNACVLIALRYRKRRTSRMHYFIMHLSIADMLVAVFNILPQMLWDAIYPFRGGDALCRIVPYLQVMVLYLSSYVLLLTAFDRYRAICRPLSNYAWTQRRLHLQTACVWIIAAIFSLPQLFLFRMRRIPLGVRDCVAVFQPMWTLKLYVTSFAVLVYFLPLAILAVLYGRICYKVWRNVHAGGSVVYKFNGSGHISIISDRSVEGRRPESSSSPPPTSQRHESRTFSRSKIKTIKMTFVVIVAYLICWFPYMTLQLWWAYDPNAPYNHKAFVLCVLLAGLNSCCNPLIYMAFSGSLVQHALPCCPRNKKRRQCYARRPPPPPQQPQPPAHRRPPQPPPHTASVTIAEKAAESGDAAVVTRIRNNDMFCDRHASRRGLLTSGQRMSRKKYPATCKTPQLPGEEI